MNRKTLTKEYGGSTGPLGFPMLSDMAKLAEEALKNQPKELKDLFSSEVDGQIVPGYLRAFVVPKKVDLGDDRTDVSLITTASMDRDFEMIDPNGLDFTQFRKNMVVPFAHDYRSLPVGKAMWVKRQKSSDPASDGWLAKTKYVGAPDGWKGDWFPDAVWHLVKNKMLMGKSVGFIPTEYSAPNEKEIVARPELAKSRGVVRRGLMLEYSVAPVQSNPDAIVQEVAKCCKVAPEELMEALGIAAIDFDLIRPQLPQKKELQDSRATPGRVVKAAMRGGLAGLFRHSK